MCLAVNCSAIFVIYLSVSLLYLSCVTGLSYLCLILKATKISLWVQMFHTKAVKSLLFKHIIPPSYLEILFHILCNHYSDLYVDFNFFSSMHISKGKYK